MEKTIELLIIIMLLAIMAEIYLLVKPRRHAGSGTQLSILVDTSVLMDGRVVDLAKTGFLLGQIIVPRSVLIELQLLADGADHAKRERARFGMDAMKELKDVLGGSFTLLDDATRIPEGVDNRLLQLAKEMNGAILTLDYNLNKVAQVEGIQILNINELAKSLRMSYLPGDELVIRFIPLAAAVLGKGPGADWLAARSQGAAFGLDSALHQNLRLQADAGGQPSGQILRLERLSGAHLGNQRLNGSLIGIAGCHPGQRQLLARQTGRVRF